MDGAEKRESRPTPEEALERKLAKPGKQGNGTPPPKKLDLRALEDDYEGIGRRRRLTPSIEERLENLEEPFAWMSDEIAEEVIDSAVDEVVNEVEKARESQERDELDRAQEELERQAELERRADLERKAELERAQEHARQAELERVKELEHRAEAIRAKEQARLDELERAEARKRAEQSERERVERERQLREHAQQRAEEESRLLAQEPNQGEFWPEAAAERVVEFRQGEFWPDEGFQLEGEEGELPPRPASTNGIAPSGETYGRWSFVQRFVFLWACVYFLLYTLPWPLNMLPDIGRDIARNVSDFWNKATPWFAELVFGIEKLSMQGSGSGDQLNDWMRFAAMLAITLPYGICAAFVSRPWARLPRLREWLVVAISFYLGTVMLGYGWLKLFPAQMTPPSMMRLVTPYGESSPMGLAWTFIGFSPWYTAFTGLGEVVGGYLLFFRKTRTLGAVVLTAVLANVVMINFCYDVPVKLFSSHLLLMAVGLLYADRRRMLRVFWRGAPTAAPRVQRLAPWPWLRVVLFVVGAGIVGYATYVNARRGWDRWTQFGAVAPRSPLYGIWDIEEHVVDDAGLPATIGDRQRWRALLIQRPDEYEISGQKRAGFIQVWLMSGSFLFLPIQLDGEELVVAPRAPKGGWPKGVPDFSKGDKLRFERPTRHEMRIRGTFRGKEIDVRAKRRDLDKRNLTGRGFNWVQERPYNR